MNNKQSLACKAGKIHILTAVHNDLHDTIKLLKCIYSQTYKNFDVYLVDDGSSDGTREYVSRKYPEVNLLKGDGNLWWTGSLNLGLKSILKRASGNDYIWIINNDCYFDKNTLEELYNFGEAHGGIGNIVGSVVVDAKTKKIWDSGVRINWHSMKFSKFNFTEKKVEADALSTKGTLYPASVFKVVGLFDAKHFPHYFSDYEFSIRAKAASYHLLINPSCIIYNEIARTGIEKAPQSFKPFEMFKVLFSKKSKISFATQINIIRYVCPPEYRLENYLKLVRKMLSYPFQVFH